MIQIRTRTNSANGAAASALCGLLLAIAYPLSATADRPPNIVMIISDDQAYDDFGFMGNPDVRTPALDRLAAQSARFINGYVPSSVCRPSLATLLTGLYPHRHGIHFNHGPPGNAGFNRMTSREEYVAARSPSFELIRSVDTLPRLLAVRLGYRCLQTGKFWEGHYRNAGFTDGMTLFEAVPGQTFGGNRRLADGTLVAHGNGDHGLKIGRETMRPIEDFLDTVGEQPFFIWYAPFLPHQPHDAPARYAELYRDNDRVPEHFRPYYAAISQFDDTVGQLIDSIERRGHARETIFVFVIDNGWRPSTRPLGRRAKQFKHTQQSKRSPFDDGLRTPILIRWDGRLTPATHEQLVGSVDLVPTLLAAVGLARAASGLPGENLLPLGRGEVAPNVDRAVFGAIYPGDASVLGRPWQDVAYRWVRRGRWKLIVTHNAGNASPWGGYLSRDALFDVVDDPRESNNRIDEPQRAEMVAELRRLLDDWWTPRTAAVHRSEKASSP